MDLHCFSFATALLVGTIVWPVTLWRWNTSSLYCGMLSTGTIHLMWGVTYSLHYCLTETWIKPSTTSYELINCTPHNHSLLSFPRHPSTHTRSSCNIGGGTGFLIREPFTQLPTSIPAFSSFESSGITLKLLHWKLSVFNVYPPPNSSPFTKSVTLFLDEFHSFLSLAATTPHELLITGNFNFHLDDLTDSHTTQFLSPLFFQPYTTRKFFCT